MNMHEKGDHKPKDNEQEELLSTASSSSKNQIVAEEVHQTLTDYSNLVLRVSAIGGLFHAKKFGE